MCGIIGMIANRPVAEPIVDALKRLEYRGYDSAGVATLDGGPAERRRAEGKLFNLEKSVTEQPLGGSIGIGHTRWATHGAPTVCLYFSSPPDTGVEGTLQLQTLRDRSCSHTTRGDNHMQIHSGPRKYMPRARSA